MKNSSKGLGFRLSFLFAVFLALTLILVGATTYVSQLRIHRAESEANMRNVASYLAGLVETDGWEFTAYKDYYEKHHTEVDIPIDVSEHLSFKSEYEKLLHEHHPGKTVGVDISIEELDPEVQEAWFKYNHVYWLLAFEKAREAFDLPYTYFLIPYEKNHHVIYMIDAERASRADHLEFIEKYPELKADLHEQGDESEYLYLGDEYENSLEENEILWKTWETGEVQDGYRIWHNQWGDTYSCYAPVVIDGEKIGLTVAEVEIADVNKAILGNTLRQLAFVAILLTVIFIVLGTVIRKRHIGRIVRLEKNVLDYTETKDPAVSADIVKFIKGKDEIDMLAQGIVSMILEIENYIKSLTIANRELDQTKDLAEKDALTGVRNRMAYHRAMAELDAEIAKGSARFAIVMIDLNYLKAINDNYGHEKGNDAIRMISRIICEVFAHSPVFRAGGDEFIVLLRNADYDNRDQLKEEFLRRIDALQEDDTVSEWEKVTAAIGIAVYDEKKDGGTGSVFNRADSRMYECKKEMKRSE